MLNRRTFIGSASLVAAAPALAQQQAGFRHGVASGDPLTDRVILWTRVTGYSGAVEVQVEVAEKPDFSGPLRRRNQTTDATRDYTVKVDFDGLAPGKTYYYRFRTDQHASPVGRTRTLPTAGVESVRLAVVSCSNYPAGYFNVYRALGHYNDLDAVLHLGDYIYEYAKDGYASERAAEFGRVVEPPTEILSLNDYRQRYQQYRSDEDLQYAHGRLPFIVIWDDHEITNDAWIDGAQNHSADEGDYAQRKQVALQAFYEWLPVREPTSRGLESPYRSFDFGEIATLAVIETRLTARDEPVTAGRDIKPAMAWYDPQADYRYVGQSGAKTAGLEPLPAIARGTTPVTDYQAHQTLVQAENLPDGYHYVPDVEDFRTTLKDPTRRLMGAEQLDWLATTFDASATAGKAWQLLGNQTLLSSVNAPNLLQALSPEEQAALPGFIRGLVPLSQYGLPLNLDAWDGYPAARERLFERIPRAQQMIALAGDTHNAWAGPLRRKNQTEYAGYEFGTPSVSSPGLAETLRVSGDRLRGLLAAANPQFDYLQMSQRGYLVVTLAADAASGQYHFVNRIDQRRFFTSTDPAIQLRR